MRTLCAILLGLLLTSAALADTIRLTNGIVLNGRIVEHNDTEVVIQLSEVDRRITVPRELVADVLETPLTVTPDGESSPTRTGIGLITPELPETSEPQAPPEPIPAPNATSDPTAVSEPPVGAVPLMPGADPLLGSDGAPTSEVVTAGRTPAEEGPGERVYEGPVVPFARIERSEGLVEIQRAGSSRFIPLEPGDRIVMTGEQVRTGTSGQLWLETAASGRLWLQGDSTLRAIARREAPKLFEFEVVRGIAEVGYTPARVSLGAAEIRIENDFSRIRLTRGDEGRIGVHANTGSATLEVWDGPYAQLRAGEGLKLAPTQEGFRFEGSEEASYMTRVWPGGRNSGLVLGLGPGARLESTITDDLIEVSERGAKARFGLYEDTTVEAIPDREPAFYAQYDGGQRIGFMPGIDVPVELERGQPQVTFKDGSCIRVGAGVVIDMYNPRGVFDNGGGFRMTSPLAVDLFVDLNMAGFYGIQVGPLGRQVIMVGPGQFVDIGAANGGTNGLLLQDPDDGRQVVLSETTEGSVVLHPDGTIEVVTADRSARLDPMSPPMAVVDASGNLTIYNQANQVQIGPGQMGMVSGGDVAVAEDYRFRGVAQPGRSLSGLDITRTASPSSPTSPGTQP